MPTVATLNTLLTAEASGFTSGIGQAVSSLSSLTAAAGPVGIAIGAVVAAGVAGATALTALAFSCGSAIDQLGDLSAKLGTTTEGLSALQYAAAQNGSSGEAVAAGIAVMNRKLGEAVQKGGQAADSLKTLGLDARNLAAMQPDQAFLLIADAIGKLPTAAERAAASTAILGRSGQDLMPLFRQGGDAIKSSMEEAAQLGVAVSQFDTLKVQELWDAFGKLQALITGVGNSLIAEVAPYLTLVIEKFVAWASTSTMLQSAWEVAIGFLTGSLGVLADAAQVVLIGIKYLEVAFSQIAIVGTMAIQDIAQAWSGFMELIGMGPSDLTWADDMVKEANRAATEASKELANMHGEKWWSVQIQEDIDALKVKSEQMAEANKETAQSFAYLDQMAEQSDQKKGAGKKSTGPTNPGAYEKGSKEAFSMIFGNKSNQSIEKNTSDSVKELKRLNSSAAAAAQQAKEAEASVVYSV